MILGLDPWLALATTSGAHISGCAYFYIGVSCVVGLVRHVSVLLLLLTVVVEWMAELPSASKRCFRQPGTLVAVKFYVDRKDRQLIGLPATSEIPKALEIGVSKRPIIAQQPYNK